MFAWCSVEASLLALDSLLELRSSICRVVWSRRQPLASVGAVLSLLDGPAGCDPALCVVWFRFRLFRRYLALWPSQVGRVYRLFEVVGEGCPGHGPVHLLVASAAGIGFRWDPLTLAWSRPGLPLHNNLAGPIQHFQAAVLDAWRNKAAADLCGREGFRSGPLLDVHGSLQLLNSSHVRERDKALLRSVMVGGVRNDFLLGRVRGRPVPCRFCGAPDCDGHLFFFGECTFPPLVEIRENPEFHDIMREDKAHWPRCLLWHGWLPMLSGVNGASPWAPDASESAFYLVETALGRYSSGLVSEWSHPHDFDADEVSALCGVGSVVVGFGACAGVSCGVSSGVVDDVDDACMDGSALGEIRVVSDSVVQSFTEYHNSSCARLNALQNSRVGRGHQVWGGTKRSSTVSLCMVRLSAGKKTFFFPTAVKKSE